MAWPPAWGFIYWRFIHSSAMAYRGKEIPTHVSNKIEIFFKIMCQILPCPGCRLHCISHTMSTPPVFKNGGEFWEYMVNFHNSVNVRTDKLEISSLEAEEVLQKQLSEFKLTTDNLEDAFLQDYWNVIIYAAFTFSTTPDKTSGDEQNRLNEFLKGACVTLPFTHKILEDGKTAGETMLEFVSNPANVDLSSRDKALETITNMHNSVCKDFSIMPQTTEESKTLFMLNFDTANYSKLVRAHQIREEDHLKMTAMKKELTLLRGEDTTSTGDKNDNQNIPLRQDTSLSNKQSYGGSTDDDFDYWKTIAITLICLISIVVMSILLGWPVIRLSGVNKSTRGNPSKECAHNVRKIDHDRRKRQSS